MHPVQWNYKKSCYDFYEKQFLLRPIFTQLLYKVTPYINWRGNPFGEHNCRPYVKRRPVYPKLKCLATRFKIKRHPTQLTFYGTEFIARLVGNNHGYI